MTLAAKMALMVIIPLMAKVTSKVKTKWSDYVCLVRVEWVEWIACLSQRSMDCFFLFFQFTLLTPREKAHIQRELIRDIAFTLIFH